LAIKDPTLAANYQSIHASKTYGVSGNKFNEHIPEKDLDEVRAKMASITSKAFFNIATRPAKEILPNGDNAHCTILTASHWESILKPHFPDVQLVLDRPGRSCMFVPWPSCMGPILATLSQAQLDRKKVQKAEVPVSTKVSAEVKRATRKLFKS